MEILKKELEKLQLTDEEYFELIEEAREFCKNIQAKLNKKKIKADIFIGGSLAKGTIVKKKEYDIDIFVRFNEKYKEKELSEKLEKVLEKPHKIHGSRDYFQIKRGEKLFEIIPIVKISSPKKMRNVTDLSYFHVDYVSSKIKKNPKLAGEIILAKAFARACNCYGAEGYIRGFSGYGIELIVIYYGSFMNFIKAVSKMKDQVILDPEKFYKNKQDVLDNMNEAKLSSPIVFVDPTYKERNALAALSKETLEKFKLTCQRFIKSPSSRFFEQEEVNAEKFNLVIEAQTDRQEGDIAGSKLIKFFRNFKIELEKYYDVKKEDFEYGDEKKALYYFSVNKKKELILNGPPITAIEHLAEFRKKHKNIFVKNGKAFAREKIDFDIEEFVKKYSKDNKDKMKSMGIVELRIIQ